MTIYDWASRLSVDDSRSKSREDFLALCPCHSDTHASLHVYVGRDTGQVVMKCHACGATGKDVCEALGIDMKELFCDALSGEADERKPAAPKTRRKKERKLCRGPYVVGEEWGGMRTVCVYEYTDRDGRVVLRKARREQFDENGVRVKKSFLMQSIGKEGEWYADAGIYINLLYHLPDVLASVKKGGTILIAEGEKDVDNLRALGYNATCGLCGGGTGKLEGKWNEDHMKALAGAERVVVMPDNDAAGEGLAQWICKHLDGQVKELRILRIAERYPSLPEHGDFSDWAAALKAERAIRRSELMAAMNSMIEEAPVWTAGNVRKFDGKKDKEAHDGEDEEKDDTEPYYGSKTYCVKFGRLARRTRESAQILCDFVPEPKETIHYVDGATVQTEYVIGGRAANGTRLPDAHVLGEAELAAMRWPMKWWLHWGNVKPCKNARDMILDAINTAGQSASEERTVYRHTGFEMIDGSPCYLYNGGAIGTQRASVELTDTLVYYRMDETDASPQEAALAERALLEQLPARIIYPMLAQAYLAPLYSELEAMQEPPSYVVFLIGPSGCGKSTVTGYVAAHFGSFYERRFPANFSDTANKAREKAYLTKDALYVVDDYVPNREGKRSTNADMVANAVISAVADRAERGRMSSTPPSSQAGSGRSEGGMPARCTCIMTGEDLPSLTISRQMRLYRIDIEAGEIAQDMHDLESLRVFARGGLYRQAMRGYISGLIDRWDGIRDELADRLDEASDEARRRIARREGRFQEMGMHLMCGVGLMLDYLTEAGALDDEERAQFYETGCAAIAENIEAQGRTVDEGKPETVWLRTLRSLLTTRSVTFMDRDELMSPDAFRAGMIGYRDASFYYVDAGAADEAIRERLRKGGVELGVSGSAIYRALAAQGYLYYEAEKDHPERVKNPQRVISIRGRKTRCLWIYRWVLDGGKPPDPAKAMEGFTPLEGKQTAMPFGANDKGQEDNR